jgi:hypothetical protein
MHRSWQYYLVVPFLIILSIFVMPSRAIGLCHTIPRPIPETGMAYQVQPQHGAQKSWSSVISEFDHDSITVAFNNMNQLDINAVKSDPAEHGYLYIVIFRYDLRVSDYISIRGGDQCVGMAKGESVGVPKEVFVARVTGS